MVLRPPPNVSPPGMAVWIAEAILAAGPLSVTLIDEDYDLADAPTHTYLTDVSGSAIAGATTPIAGVITVDGNGVIVTDTTTTTVPSVTNAEDVIGVIITFDDGVGDRVAFVVTGRDDRVLISVTPDGSDITVSFPTGEIFRP